MHTPIQFDDVIVQETECGTYKEQYLWLDKDYRCF